MNGKVTSLSAIWVGEVVSRVTRLSIGSCLRTIEGWRLTILTILWCRNRANKNLAAFFIGDVIVVNKVTIFVNTRFNSRGLTSVTLITLVTFFTLWYGHFRTVAKGDDRVAVFVGISTTNCGILTILTLGDSNR